MDTSLLIENFPKHMKKKQKKTIFKLETFNWNKVPKKDQDKALTFLTTVLAELEENRKHGYDPKFWAEYP